ncbi:MAG: SUMF1/EgtB/PvdO family nonheme iron enzyme [Gammaproteobacteria bacterium]|nr:MAG: SUMF1/EgtB/PvdO family nonheme iron enzyme [Gammaproteobacteria bacterium]
MRVRWIRLNACVKSSLSRNRGRLFAGMLSLLPGIVMAAAEPQWAEKYYNPKPAAEDVVIPTPCGGAMTFRRVSVESSGLLDDRMVTVGNSSEELGYAENPHHTHIAGSFSGTPNSRYFLLGKYEVSQAQYESVMSGECRKPTMKKRLPQAAVNWFDAVEFAHRYSLWLSSPAGGAALPKEGGVAGFVRLPTEDEWEYAARGGDHVSLSDFREKTAPMPEGIARYIWSAGTASANGKAQLTGLLEPNPLGLHDMLGNVDEIALELFRLNRLDRMHGQVGGFVIRGGNYFTAAPEMRSSLRQEVPFYKDGKALKSKTTGFRVVISTPVITSPARLQKIAEAWRGLGTGDGVADEHVYTKLKGKTFDNPVEELAAIASAMSDKSMKQRITALRDTMRATIEARNRQRDQAARESLRLGGVLCQKLRDDNKAVSGLEKVYKKCVTARGESDKRCARYKNKLDTEQDVQNYNLGVYAESVMGTAQNYPGTALEPQLDLLIEGLKKRRFENLVPFVRVYSKQAGEYGSDWRVRRQDWFRQCVSES